MSCEAMKYYEDIQRMTQIINDICKIHKDEGLLIYIKVTLINESVYEGTLVEENIKCDFVSLTTNPQCSGSITLRLEDGNVQCIDLLEIKSVRKSKI